MFQHLYRVEVLEFTWGAANVIEKTSTKAFQALHPMDWNPIFKENEHFLWSHLPAAKFPWSILNFFWRNIGEIKYTR